MDAQSNGRRWYAVHTHPNRENLAEDQIKNQGFHTFFPRQRRSVRHARKTEKRITSYFPGYLFVCLDMKTDRWRSINGTLGVRSLVMQGERPLPVPKGVIEGLKLLVDASGFILSPQDLHPSEKFRAVDGLFNEMISGIDQLDRKHREHILLQMLHG